MSTSIEDALRELKKLEEIIHLQNYRIITLEAWAERVCILEIVLYSILCIPTQVSTFQRPFVPIAGVVMNQLRTRAQQIQNAQHNEMLIEQQQQRYQQQQQRIAAQQAFFHNVLNNSDGAIPRNGEFI